MGIATVLIDFTGTRSVKELVDVGCTEVRIFWSPATPVILIEKEKGKYGVICHLVEEVKDRLVLGVLDFDPRLMGPIIS